MKSHTRNLYLAVTLGVLATTAPACAQENLDQGKTAQQLFESDCAICHKSAQGLAAKAGNGLDGFLREHYTASRQTASVLAKYLASVGDAPAAVDTKPGNSRRAAKPSATKPGDAKSKSDAKSDAKSDVKSNAQTESKTESKTEPKTEVKSEAKPESKPEAKSQSKTETDKPAKSE